MLKMIIVAIIFTFRLLLATEDFIMSIRNLLTSITSTVDSTVSTISSSMDWATRAISTNRKRWELGEEQRTEEYLLELDSRMDNARLNWVKARTKYESQVSEEQETAVNNRLAELKKQFNLDK